MATVLVVEDNPVEAQVVSRLLQASGMSVRLVGNGEEALAALAEEPPELVLTDLVMPGVSGLELVESIRLQHPDLPVILMTAFGSAEVAVEALRKGAASYVPKRRLQAELVETVGRALTMARERRERTRALRTLISAQSRFELENDQTLIAPLVSYLQDCLSCVGECEENLLLQVGVALEEALRNAMHHGNLEVGSDLRESGSQFYSRQVERRRAEAPYRDRRVRLAVHMTPRQAEFVVGDEGPGFDPRTVRDPTAPENLLKVSGRGLYLIWTFMDEVRYNEAGNQITMIKRLDEGRPEEPGPGD